jgi:hypothetical protein
LPIAKRKIAFYNKKMIDILIENRRKNISGLKERYKDYIILDLTSKSEEKWIRFSPFYPHGNIPVPFSDGYFSETVEGIWQGLKVFEDEKIDISKFTIKNLKGLKRTTRKHGRIIGHQKGVKSTELLNYLDAKKFIYLPSYKWILDNKLKNEINDLKEFKKIVFLDYNVNLEIFNYKPLSHANLVKTYLENNYP